MGVTPAQFIQNWFLGAGVSITNATFNGSSSIMTSNQLGSFIASGNAFMQMGIDSGMILTSGQADLAVGPNYMCGDGANTGISGDPDLNILAGVTTYDRCVIEFDFIPLSDTVKFRYVFGSEELFEYCNQFNDPFGFFLSGPGISGPFSNNSVDIALMPGTSDYVTINNICSHSLSVWCNSPVVCGSSLLCHNVPPNGGVYYQYNALTYVFTAWHTVQPCNTYHIKIAIADALDHVLDSGVFLDKGSFSISSASVNGPSPVCAGISGNVYITQPGKQNYLWTVSPGGIITAGGTSSSNTVTVTWQTAGQQTVSVIYTNPGGCTLTDPAICNVLVNPLPIPSISGASVACLYSTGNTYTSQTGMNNYIWTVSSGGMITAGGTSTSNFVSITWNNTGNQTVTVNYTDNNGCTAANPSTFMVDVEALPIPTITGPATPCVLSSGNTYITDPGMTSYLWGITPGGTITSGLLTNTIIVTWHDSGNQTVFVSYTDNYGCIPASPAIFMVDVKPLPVPGITGPASPCVLTNGNIYITDPGMTSYIWTVSPGGIITAGLGTDSITVTWNIAGPQYVGVIYTDQNGCTANFPALYNVIVNPLPGAAGNVSGPSTVCIGADALVYTVTPVTNASSYFWTLPPGFLIISGGGTNSITLDLDSTASSGNIIVYGNNPCGAGTPSPPFPVIVNTPPQGNAGPDGLICQSNPFTVTQASASNYNAINWYSNGQGVLDNNISLSPTYTPAQGETGQVTLSLILTGNAPCGTDTSMMMLDIKPKAIVNAGSDQISCGQAPVVLAGSLALNYQALHWTTSGSGTFDDPSVLHPAYTPGISDVNAGSVFLTLIATSAEPCDPASDTVILSLAQGPSASPGPDGIICQGMSYTIHGVQISHSSGFRWVDDGHGELKDTTTLNPTYIPATDETGVVRFTLNAYGIFACQDSSATCQMNIFIYSRPGVDAGPDQSIKYDSSTTLICETSGGSGNFEYKWAPASLLVDNTVEDPQTLSLVKDTLFTATVTDKATGCSSSDSMRVKVGRKGGEENCIVIHNVITPNGDGINDKFEIDCIELFPENKLEIFNRWGDKIKSFVHYNNTTHMWKGDNEKGEPVPDGTYYYILSIQDGGTRTGWILVRGSAAK